MKVILLKDVQKVGRKYEVKEVSGGFARNFLIPNRLAEIAQRNAVKNIETLKKRGEEERALEETLLEKNLVSLDGKTVQIAMKANEQGHLFQGIHPDEIAEAINKELGIALSGQYIQLEAPIKAVGEHAITVTAGEKTATVTLDVVPLGT